MTIAKTEDSTTNDTADQKSPEFGKLMRMIIMPRNKGGTITRSSTIDEGHVLILKADDDALTDKMQGKLSPDTMRNRQGKIDETVTAEDG